MLNRFGICICETSLTVIAKQKGGQIRPFAAAGIYLGFGCTQAKDFPVLHSAAIPFDLVSGVADLEQIFDVVR